MEDQDVLDVSPDRHLENLAIALMRWWANSWLSCNWDFQGVCSSSTPKEGSAIYALCSWSAIIWRPVIDAIELSEIAGQCRRVRSPPGRAQPEASPITQRSAARTSFRRAAPCEQLNSLDVGLVKSKHQLAITAVIILTEAPVELTSAIVLSFSGPPWRTAILLPARYCVATASTRNRRDKHYLIRARRGRRPVRSRAQY